MKVIIFPASPLLSQHQAWVSVRPIKDLSGDANFSEVLFDNMLLGNDSLVGAQGGGWTQVNAELAFDRSGPERIYSSIVLLDYWIECLRKTPDGSKQSVDLPRVSPRCTTCRLL